MGTSTQETSAQEQRRQRIPTPFKVHWQRSRYQLVPIVIVTLCSIAAFQLWLRQSTRVQGIGEVTGIGARVVSPGEGLLAAPEGRSPGLYDRVAAGQVVARIRRKPADTPIEIAAPIAGKILSVHRLPGQHVKVGDVVMVIAAERGQYVTTYIHPDTGLRPEAGMAVDVRLRSSPRKKVVARLERIGPQIEAVPAHQLRTAKLRDWGLPAILALPPGFEAQPGELVDLTFRPGDKVQEFVTTGIPGELLTPASPGRIEGSKDENH